MREQRLRVYVRQATTTDFLLLVHLTDLLCQSRKIHIPKEAGLFYRYRNGDIAPPKLQALDPNEYFIALDQYGTAVGYVRYSTYDRTDKTLARLGYVEELFVRPGHLRQGVAKTLLSYIEELFLAMGCTGYTLHTDPSNIAARSLYEQVGMGAVTVEYFKPLNT